MSHLYNIAAAKRGFALRQLSSSSAPSSGSLKEPLPPSLSKIAYKVSRVYRVSRETLALPEWHAAVTQMSLDLRHCIWYSCEYWEIMRWHQDKCAELKAARAYHRHE